jgi:hypothetical protein
MTIAALSGFAVSHLLKVRLPLWTVVTAVLTRRLSVVCEGSIDYLAGTLGGAVAPGRRNTGSPFDVSLAGVLALAVAPLAFWEGFIPLPSVAPLTACWCSWFLGSSTWASINRGRSYVRVVGGIIALAVISSGVAGPRAFVCDRGRLGR